MAYFINNIPPNSTNDRNSRYIQGGTTDVYQNRIGWWEKRKFTRNESDITVTVLEFEAGKADLISYRVYGKSVYGWLVLEYNNISDPIVELDVGKKITLPSSSRLIFDIISRPTGGNVIG